MMVEVMRRALLENDGAVVVERKSVGGYQILWEISVLGEVT